MTTEVDRWSGTAKQAERGRRSCPEGSMLAVREAHQTTTGNAVVMDEKGNLWVLKRDWLNASMTRNEKLGKAIKLFTEGTLTAFERYDEVRHGMLGGGIISS
jgi:hypothetical protein